MSVPHDGGATRLIVNADDFGYFDQVSRGILDAAERGVVTATGVMANGPALPRWIDRLKAVRSLSVGVHLNATLGRPLTAEMRDRLGNDEFPSTGALVGSLLVGKLPVSTLLHEWRAQIEHCLRAGLALRFVNSHEHVHMLPILYAKVRRLAAEFGIVHVRAPQPEWGHASTAGGWLRNGAFTLSRWFAAASARASEPILIGLAPSGRLNEAYCKWRFARLDRGASYELMCHPGWDDPNARKNPKLGAYHDWEGELNMLLGAGFAQLLHERGIKLAAYEAAS
jgi:chitin disaccharide deacetylase